MSKRGPIDFGNCICIDCPLFATKECPRVDAEAGVMCLQYHVDKDYAAALKVWQEFHASREYGLVGEDDFSKFCAERLNSEEPNCA